MCAHPQRHRDRARPSVYSVSRRRPGRSTCRFHRLHRIDIVIEARAAQSTDPIVYAVAPRSRPACVVTRESLFDHHNTERTGIGNN